ncbi:multisubunit sodium/proton antiporter, MrpD subunit [Nannocystis exedens]|uniref:Multisubunit sodium/proton antiporter, MrpD subunit n=1 Tax=Nannocystis exedens TaxID=54 RepID=A0A1I1WDB0_9BACT|nr:Na(+)/H(+) antiporter subunit D [Nannocystis exedens]PCC67586.1 Na(+)/H(+) antiporter subunit D [Nannocystis exedens]SFD92368.1 multisubunit sodium/proton antiporter, MrpD subunit [Nannocystis exedens]
MTDAVGLPPPGIILVLGGLVLPLLRGLGPAVALLLPLLTLGAIWGIPDDLTVTMPFMGQYDLTVLAFNPPTKVFATIFAVMAFAGALFAHPITGLDSERGRRWRVELPAAFVYAGSAICVTFAGDILSLFIFWELMAIGSTTVIWSAGTRAAGRAGYRYALVHFVGGVLLMAGILAKVFALQASGVSDPLALHHFFFGAAGFEGLSFGTGDAAAWLILLGILVNAAAPPLGAWLADAYPEASESGTVFLSAFTTKTAVYVLMLLFAGTQLLIYVGLLMAVYGIVYAILENDMRRILAYSIVNQVGFMVCGIGIGTAMALNGAAAHAFAHIVYKALLLMSAGSVLYMTGKRKCTDLGGLYHSMPITMTCGIIGALAISSFPLTSGFVTKSMINQAAADQHIALAWFTLTAASAGVFLHAGIKFPWFVFFQKDSGLRPPDPPWNMRAAMIFFAAVCILLGVPGLYGPLYAILPFPAAAGETLYEPYTVPHVINQLQLLLFSGLAFFALLPVLKRTLTITLDADWFYRRLFPGAWKHLVRPVVLAFREFFDYLFGQLPQMAKDIVYSPPQEARMFKEWGLGGAMVVITGFLFAYLVLGYIAA